MSGILRLLILYTAVIGSSMAAEGFAGSWRYVEGEFTSLATINAQNGQLTGKVVEGPETYSFSGKHTGNQGQITVVIGGESIPALLSVNGDQLTVSISGEQLIYLRQQPPRRPGFGGAAGRGNGQQSNPVQPGATQPAAGGTTQPTTNPGPAGPQPQGALILKRHTLVDTGMRNMQSHTVVVPQGWTVEGGAWWPNSQFFKILPSQDIKVTSPTGMMVHIGPSIGAVDYYPSQQAMQLGSQRPAEGAVDNGYPVIHYPGDLPAWGQWIKTKGIPMSFPGASDIQVEQPVIVPELTALLQRNLQPIRQQQALNNQQSQAMGGGMHSFCDGSVMAALTRYSLNGKKWEHLFIFGVTIVGLDSQMGRQLWWSVEPSVSYRAEAGTLESHLPMLFTIANSVQPTPQWAKMKADHIAKMNQISNKGAQDRARILSNSNAEINQMIHDGWKKREGIRDRTNQKVIDTIRGVERYNDPMSNSPVELPNTYQHVYSNGTGDYIMTNDHLYNPNTDNNVNNQQWNSLSRVP